MCLPYATGALPRNVANSQVELDAVHPSLEFRLFLFGTGCFDPDLLDDAVFEKDLDRYLVFIKTPTQVK